MTDPDTRLDTPPPTDAATPPPEDASAPQAELAALHEEKNSWQERALRAAAEMENLRKRTQTEVAEARLYAAQAFAKDILGVADNLERALAAPAGDAEALRKGVELTATGLASTLNRHGISKVNAAPGETLNPELHQAMTQTASDQPAGTIHAELQPGYTLHGRLLRPALVSVSGGADA